MDGKPIRLFRLCGFSVRADPSWFVLALLIVWTLSAGYFPAVQPGLSPGLYLAMGLAAAAGLFSSIVFHELWHSLVARRYGLPIRGITLFIFGGVAEMEDEPVNPKAESLMAAAGPAASVVLAAVLAFAAALGPLAGWPPAVTAVLRYLSGLNLALAAFNLLPGFPLDGGRLLRAGLWAWRRDIRWATRIAARVGAGFGTLLLMLGFLNAIGGRLLGGIWWFILGLFLRGVAASSYQRLLIREGTAGHTIDEMMDRDPPRVPVTATVQRLVDDYFLTHYHRTFPVVEGERLVGCVNIRRLKDIPRERWASASVRELLEPCGADNTVPPGLPVARAAGTLQGARNDQLIVADDSRLIGTVAAEDLSRYMAVRLEVEEATVSK